MFKRVKKSRVTPILRWCYSVLWYAKSNLLLGVMLGLIIRGSGWRILLESVMLPRDARFVSMSAPLPVESRGQCLVWDGALASWPSCRRRLTATTQDWPMASASRRCRRFWRRSSRRRRRTGSGLRWRRRGPGYPAGARGRPSFQCSLFYHLETKNNSSTVLHQIEPFGVLFNKIQVSWPKWMNKRQVRGLL